MDVLGRRLAHGVLAGLKHSTARNSPKDRPGIDPARLAKDTAVRLVKTSGQERKLQALGSPHSGHAPRDTTDVAVTRWSTPIQRPIVPAATFRLPKTLSSVDVLIATASTDNWTLAAQRQAPPALTARRLPCPHQEPLQPSAPYTTASPCDHAHARALDTCLIAL